MSVYHALAFLAGAGHVIVTGTNEEAYRVARKYKVANPAATVVVAHEERSVSATEDDKAEEVGKKK